MKGHHMKRKQLYTLSFIAMLIACLSIIGSSVMAGSRLAKIAQIPMKDLSQVEFQGIAFNINTTDSFLFVDQTEVNIVENQSLKSGEVISSVILDEKGNRIPLTQIKDYQRVFVKGLSTARGFTIALKIQRQPLRPGDKSGPSSVPR